MGATMEAACVTCREVHYFGYGSRLSVIGFVNTVEEFDAEAARLVGFKDVSKGSRAGRVRKFLETHGGHDLTWWTDESAWVTKAGDREVVAGDYVGEILDVTGWKFVDWEQEANHAPNTKRKGRKR